MKSQTGEKAPYFRKCIYIIIYFLKNEDIIYIDKKLFDKIKLIYIIKNLRI